MNAISTKGGWKRKVVHELIEYWTIVLYLAVFLGVFAMYRRLILRQYSIDYLYSGTTLIKAMVLAKFIMIIDALHAGRKQEKKPLAYSTFYKATIFTLCVLALNLAEEVIRGFCKGKGIPGVREQLESIEKYEALANCLVTFFAFIPFFAFREIGRIIGHDKMVGMFFGE